MRRCDTVENIHEVVSDPCTRQLIRSPKQVIIFIFFPIFFVPRFPRHYQCFQFLSLLPFERSEEIKKQFTGVTIPQEQHRVPSAQQSLALFGGAPAWLGGQIRIPS